MSLTPEERQRIYEEEKARLEAQERAKAEIEVVKAKAAAQVDKQRRGQWRGYLGCLGLLIVGFIGLIVLGSRLSHTTSPSATHPRPAQPAKPEQLVYLPFTADEKKNGLCPGDVAVVGAVGDKSGYFLADSESRLLYMQFSHDVVPMTVAQIDPGTVVLVLAGDAGAHSAQGGYSYVRVMPSVAVAKAVPDETRQTWNFQGPRIGVFDNPKQGYVYNTWLHLVHRARCD